jgi:hypothetical protein
MENEAAGTFDVKLAAIGAGDVPISTMSIDKTFHGDLQSGLEGAREVRCAMRQQRPNLKRFFRTSARPFHPTSGRSTPRSTK